MESKQLRNEINRKLREITSIDQSNLTTPYEVKKRLDEIDFLEKEYIKLVEKESYEVQKEFLSVSKHGFGTVFHRLLTLNSPKIKPTHLIVLFFLLLFLFYLGLS